MQTREGAIYLPRTYAAPDDRGVWEAWLEFHPVDHDAPAVATERETSQSSRAAGESGALGLEAVYLQGAFARARVVYR
jgi:hypothetical protein